GGGVRDGARLGPCAVGYKARETQAARRSPAPAPEPTRVVGEPEHGPGDHGPAERRPADHGSADHEPTRLVPPVTRDE
ncbi:hypothetical protein PV678_03605, partial [Streptomyces europaeiscabiei]|nr:hypothetical protein [Streptomyces europaeiscabiei]